MAVISGMAKVTHFKFSMHFIVSIRAKAHQNNLGKVSIDVVRESEKFSGHSCIRCIAIHAVIFAIAQLSCWVWHGSVVMHWRWDGKFVWWVHCIQNFLGICHCRNFKNDLFLLQLWSKSMLFFLPTHNLAPTCFIFSRHGIHRSELKCWYRCRNWIDAIAN